MKIRLFTAKPDMRPLGETDIPDSPNPPEVVIFGMNVYQRGVLARTAATDGDYRPYIEASAYPISEPLTPIVPVQPK